MLEGATLGGRYLLLALAIAGLSAMSHGASSAPAAEPTDAAGFYQRGMARWASGQPLLAMDDLNRVLKLRPRDVPALVSRAELHLALRDSAGAVADLDAAAGSAAEDADVRLILGNLYTRVGHFEHAIAQYDLWIAAHPRSARRRATAFQARCWVRALWGEQLSKALSDCNTAWRLKPGTPGLLDSRALVEFRLGKLAQSIGDYDQALHSQPKNAWLRYARGVAELRAGRTAAGRADIAAAEALQPLISGVGRQRGVVP